MFRQVNFYLLGLVSLCAVLIIGINGCGQDDDNEWLGTWTLETVDGESIQAQFKLQQIDILPQINQWDSSVPASTSTASKVRSYTDSTGV